MISEEKLEKVISVTAQMRLDLAAAYEEQHHPPVYARTKALLDAWMSQHDFKPNAIRGLEPQEAIYVVGNADSAYPYGLVWVSAHLPQPKVRAALVNTIADCYHLPEDCLTIVHADHLFNKASVKDIPDAWLLIFPTIAEVNWKSGWRLERGLRVDSGADYVELLPFHFFKMLSNFWPTNQAEFEAGMAIVAGQHLVEGLDVLIQQAIGPAFNFPGVE